MLNFRRSKLSDDEATVERFFVAEVKRRGGFTIKLRTFLRGLPDRFTFLPGGVFVLVELKRPKGGVFEPLQENWHKKFRKLGFRIGVLRTKDEVMEFLDEC